MENCSKINKKALFSNKGYYFLFVFSMNKIKQFKTKEMLSRVHQCNEDPDKLFINEIKKPPYAKCSPSKLKKYNNKHIDRNLDLTAYIFTQIKGFNDYRLSKKITYEELHELSKFFTYEFYPKGSCIYSQGEKPNYFYGVVNGKVQLLNHVYKEFSKDELLKDSNDYFNESSLKNRKGSNFNTNTDPNIKNSSSSDGKSSVEFSNSESCFISKEKEKSSDEMQYNNENNYNNYDVENFIHYLNKRRSGFKRNKSCFEFEEKLFRKYGYKKERNFTPNQYIYSIKLSIYKYIIEYILKNIYARKKYVNMKRSRSYINKYINPYYSSIFIKNIAKRRNKDIFINNNICTKKNNYNSNMKNNITDEEKNNINFLRMNLLSQSNVYEKESCFGDDDIIKKKNRTNYAYCLENTQLFSISREKFDKYITNKLILKENKKIEFFYSKIQILKENSNFLPLILQIQETTFNKNQIIYSQFAPAENIYLVYKGECAIAKNKSRGNPNDEQADFKILSILKEGAIGGLEGYLPENTYENYLISNSYNTSVFKININDFNNVDKRFRTSLKNLYLKQQSVYDLISYKKKFTINKKLFLLQENSVLKTSNKNIGNSLNEKEQSQHNLNLKTYISSLSLNTYSKNNDTQIHSFRKTSNNISNNNLTTFTKASQNLKLLNIDYKKKKSSGKLKVYYNINDDDKNNNNKKKVENPTKAVRNDKIKKNASNFNKKDLLKVSNTIFNSDKNFIKHNGFYNSGQLTLPLLTNFVNKTNSN